MAQLNHLLDLKQKDVNITQTNQMKNLAKHTDDQTEKMKGLAEETANQGRFIFVFTVVTVVFVSLYPRPLEGPCTDHSPQAPLAFMATLFALPIPDQFPQSQNGTNEFSTSYVSNWMGKPFLV
jgi:hypothetical protein